MIKIYVHNSLDDLYTVMVTENDKPIISDCLRGRYELSRNVNFLIEELGLAKQVPIKVISEEIIDKIKL